MKRIARWTSGATLTLLLLSSAAGGEQPGSLNRTLDGLLGVAGGLDADQVARRAVATSYDVQAQRHDVAEAVAGVDQALAAYFPRLALGGRYTRLSGIVPPRLANFVMAPGLEPGPVPQGTPLSNVALAYPVLLNQYLVQATLTVPLSDYALRLRPEHAAAVHARREALIGEKVALLAVGLSARVTYYNWVRSCLQAAVFEQGLRQTQQHLDEARQRLAAGLGSQADVLRVESQVASAELLLLRARHLSELMEERVRTAMHDPSTVRYRIGEDLRVELPALDGVGDREAVVAEALGGRQELRALQERAGGLRQRVKSASAGLVPRVEVFGEVTYANPNPRYFPPQDDFRLTWSVGAQLSWSVNELGGALIARRGATARLLSSQARERAMRDTLRTEVIQSQQALLEVDLALRTTARGLASSEEAHRVRHALFRNGRATSIELIDAEADLTRARLEALNARVDLRIARLHFLHATGRDAAGVGSGGRP